MEDPLKIYNDILSIALEEFVEDEHPRKDDGKFAKKEDAGDDAGADDTSFTKIGGSKNNTLDSFIKTDNEEPEIEYMDDNEIAEDEKYMDYLARMGGFQNTQYVTDGVKDGIPYTSTLDSLSEDSQRFEYMIRNHTPEEQARFRQRRFKEWKDDQVKTGGEITSPIIKNYSGRIAIDPEQLSSSIRSYAKFHNKEMINDYRDHNEYLHEIEDGLKGSVIIRSVDNGAGIRINMGGFSPDGVGEKNSSGELNMQVNRGGHSYRSSPQFNEGDFDEFIKKNNITLDKKSIFDRYSGTIRLHAKDVVNANTLMTYAQNQIEKNKFKIREQKKNYNKIKETEDKLSDLFGFTVSTNRRTPSYNFKSTVEAGAELHGDIEGLKDIKFEIDTVSGSDPIVKLDFPWGYETNKMRPETHSDAIKNHEFFDSVFTYGGRTVKEMEKIIPVVKEQIAEQAEIKIKLDEIKKLQEETTKKHKEDLSTIHTSYNDSEKKKEEMEKIESNLYKKTDLHKKIEPELEPEFEDIGDEEITNDDIGIGYDPRKINLDDIDLDDSQAYA